MTSEQPDRSESTFNESVRTLTRPVVTFALVLTACAGFLLGKIEPDAFVPLVVAAVGFWFAARGASS